MKCNIIDIQCSIFLEFFKGDQKIASSNKIMWSAGKEKGDNNKIRNNLPEACFEPWGSNSIEKGNDGRYVNCTPLWYNNFRNQYGSRDHHAVEHKGYYMGHNLPHKEEIIDHMNFLQYRYFLDHNTTQQADQITILKLCLISPFD